MVVVVGCCCRRAAGVTAAVAGWRGAVAVLCEWHPEAVQVSTVLVVINVVLKEHLQKEASESGFIWSSNNNIPYVNISTTFQVKNLPLKR